MIIIPRVNNQSQPRDYMNSIPNVGDYYTNSLGTFRVIKRTFTSGSVILDLEEAK